MSRGVSWFFVGSFVLVALAGCGRGLFQTAEREPWRAEAEVACLKSGAVRESADKVLINPISGPGVCGAEYPLKVAALGEVGSSLGYTNDLRPPAGLGGQPNWPVGTSRQAPYSQTAIQQPSYGRDPRGPVPLNGAGEQDHDDEMVADEPPSAQAPLTVPSQQPPLPRLGPPAGNPMNAFGAVSVKPAATLACPIVSALDKWIAESIQPAAMRWFGTRVVEIKQISAYSCRSMNGTRSRHISEHAFGNALDIAAFVLADGRRITVKGGWHGMPEEQGFLRDVQAGACQHFNTVLAPGSNAAHADHFHVDLMRRSSRRLICQPAPMSGEQVASRAFQRGGGGGYPSRDGGITGSIGKWLSSHKPKPGDDDYFDE